MYIDDLEIEEEGVADMLMGKPHEILNFFLDENAM